MHDEIYRQKILDHYKHPRNFGELSKYTHEFGHQNISCGDQLQFRVHAPDGIIKQVGFTGSGCAVSMAAASLLSESLIGKKLDSIQELTKDDIESLLGISVSGARELCATLALETLKRLEKKGQGN